MPAFSYSFRAPVRFWASTPKPAAAFAAFVEFAKTVLEQRQSQPMFAPRAADSQNVDPTDIHIVIGFEAAQADACDLVAIHREEPQVGVLSIRFHEMRETDKPFLVRLFNVTEMVTEGFAHSIVNGGMSSGCWSAP
jgi:hypothetical protein